MDLACTFRVHTISFLGNKSFLDKPSQDTSPLPEEHDVYSPQQKHSRNYSELFSI